MAWREGVRVSLVSVRWRLRREEGARVVSRNVTLVRSCWTRVSSRWRTSGEEGRGSLEVQEEADEEVDLGVE